MSQNDKNKKVHMSLALSFGTYNFTLKCIFPDLEPILFGSLLRIPMVSKNFKAYFEALIERF